MWTPSSPSSSDRYFKIETSFVLMDLSNKCVLVDEVKLLWTELKVNVSSFVKYLLKYLPSNQTSENSLPSSKPENLIQVDFEKIDFC